jgi:1-acyl-sn-glycerol-3-phosphate acyltransferase
LPPIVRALSSFVRWIASLLFWAYLALSSLLFFPLALVLWLIDALFRTNAYVHGRFTCFWAFHYTSIWPYWNIRYRGRGKLPARGPYILVSNHQSAVDILVIFGLWRSLAWMAKAEMFRVPLIGWNLGLLGGIAVRRSSVSGRKAALREAIAKLQAGRIVALFPEGTRSVDGRLLPFRTGVATMARETGVAVYPVAIHGTGEALPKRGLVFPRLHPVNIDVHVLDPLFATGDESDADFAKRLQSAVAAELALMEST